MPIFLPIKAAGRTLTVGELSEALSGLADNDPVTIGGHDLLAVNPGASGLDIGVDHDCEADDAYALLDELATGKMTKGDMVAKVKAFLGVSEAA